MIFSTSVSVKQAFGKVQFLLNYFLSDEVLAVPNNLSKVSKACSVQMQNLPRCPPGASFKMDNECTLQKSTPPMFLNAFNLSSSPSWITRGPLFILNLLFLYLPFPALMFFEAFDASMSSVIPSDFKSSVAFFVFSSVASTLITNGNSGTLVTLCPLPCTRAVIEVAATVDAMA